MIINDANLRSMFTGFKANFQNGFGRPKSFYEKVAMTTTSVTGENTYAWLGQFPRIREWLGDRVIQNLETRGYTIVNRLFEQTQSVPRTKIEDDQYGMYAPLFDEMGRDAAEFPNQLVSELLLQGFSANCYDGQFFFDSDHPVLDETGKETFVSNTGGGDGPGWYLIDGSRSIGAMIYQKRMDFEFQSLDDGSQRSGGGGLSDRTFFKDEYVFGLRGRSNAGFGLWQMAYGSRQPLTAANYAEGRRSMQTLKGDWGRKLGIKPTMLLVPPELESAALKIINNNLDGAGGTNEWAGTVELVITPWLSA